MMKSLIVCIYGFIISAQAENRAVVVTVSSTGNTPEQSQSILDSGKKMINFLQKHDPNIEITYFESTGRKPYKNDVVNCIRETATKSVPGDTLIFFITCHGLYSKDGNMLGLESHQQLYSNDLREAIYHAPTGVRILLIIEACQSGSMARVRYTWQDGDWRDTGYHEKEITGNNKPLVLCISACADNESGWTPSGEKFMKWFTKNKDNDIPFDVINEIIPDFNTISISKMDKLQKQYNLFMGFFYCMFLVPRGDTKSFGEMFRAFSTHKMNRDPLLWNGKRVTPALTSNFKIDLSTFTMRDFFTNTAGKCMYLDSDGVYKVRTELSPMGEKCMIKAMGYDPDALNLMHYIFLVLAILCFIGMMVFLLMYLYCPQRVRFRRRRRNDLEMGLPMVRRHGVRGCAPAIRPEIKVVGARNMLQNHPLSRHRRNTIRMSQVARSKRPSHIMF